MATTEPKTGSEARTTESGHGRTQGKDNEGWTIAAGKQRARKAQESGAVSRSVPTHDKARGTQARDARAQQNSKGGSRSSKIMRGGVADGAGRGKDDGNGNMVFNQLRQYLIKGAPAEYVQQTVLKLVDLATERRYAAYLELLPAQQVKDKEQSQLRQEWQDAIPYRLRERNEGWTSVWQVLESAQQSRLALVMHQWIIIDKEPQVEVEERLRFFHLERRGQATEEGRLPSREPGTFLAAVTSKEMGRVGEEGKEVERLRELCLQPVTATTKLRKRTAGEKKALVMILKHRRGAQARDDIERNARTFNEGAPSGSARFETLSLSSGRDHGKTVAGADTCRCLSLTASRQELCDVRSCGDCDASRLHLCQLVMQKVSLA